MKTYMKNARLSLGGDNRLQIVVPDGLASDYLKNQDNKEQLQRIIGAAVQKEIEIEVQAIGDSRDFEDAYIDLSQIIRMEIEVEEN